MKNELFMQKIGVLLCILICSCSTNRTIESSSEEELFVLDEFRTLPTYSRITIAKENEPGERLLLCLRYIQKENKQPVSNQRIHFYHTSSTGEYQPSNPRDETTARLNGAAISDQDGRLLIDTILPGDYGNSSDNRHIHTIVTNAQPITYDIHFKQYTRFMGKNFIDGSDQHFLADLKKLPDGVLVTFVTIEIKGWITNQ